MFNSFTVDKDPNERKMLHCNSCERSTIHVLATRCTGRWQYDHTHGTVDGGTNFNLFRCGACDEVCFHKSSWDSENIDIDENGDMYAVHTESQFPPPTSAAFTFNTEYTPEKLNSIIEEMLYALAGQKMRLSTIGLRLIIEFIVNDKNCEGGSLYKKINSLAESGLIDEDQKKLLHTIRTKGNAGAHEGIAMATKELLAGIEVVDLLIEKLYSSPGRHRDVMERAQSTFRESN